jgi:tRNA nucleotidyltransferase (CCA-adding enzyme)
LLRKLEAFRWREPQSPCPAFAHKDFDLEVYGVDCETLEQGLSAHGRVDLVGKSFGVIKFTGQSGGQWNFSLPRRGSKMTASHKGFEIEFDSGIEPRESAKQVGQPVCSILFAE